MCFLIFLDYCKRAHSITKLQTSGKSNVNLDNLAPFKKKKKKKKDIGGASEIFCRASKNLTHWPDRASWKNP